jgi:Mrp family chromosome partitioning ATPase
MRFDKREKYLNWLSSKELPAEIMNQALKVVGGLEQSLGSGRRAIALTSCSHTEGTTSVLVCLARAASMKWRERILTVDLNVRRPSLHEVFGFQRIGGVTEILADERELFESIKITLFPDLYLLTAGRAVSTEYWPRLINRK